MDTKEGCVFLLYAYSFIRNMNEERQKAFMKALLNKHHDVDGEWPAYEALFNGIKGEIQALVHQHGRYLEDLEDHPEAEVQKMEKNERYQAEAALRAILNRNRGKPDMWFKLAYGGIESPYSEEIHRDMGQCIENGLIIALHLLGDPEYPTAQQAQKKWDDLEHRRRGERH